MFRLTQSASAAVLSSVPKTFVRSMALRSSSRAVNSLHSTQFRPVEMGLAASRACGQLNASSAEQLAAINRCSRSFCSGPPQKRYRSLTLGLGEFQMTSWIKRPSALHASGLHILARGSDSSASHRTQTRSLVSLPIGDPSAKERFQTILKEYGKVVLLSHSVVWVSSLAATTAALQAMDLAKFIALLPESIASHVDPSAGAFAIAFVLVKLTGPVRLMFDIAITPTLAGYLRGTWLAGPLGLRKKDGSGGAAKGEGDSYRYLMRLAAPPARQGTERVVAWSGAAVRAVKTKFATVRLKYRRGSGGGKEGGAGAAPWRLRWTLKEHNLLLRAKHRLSPPRRDSSGPLRSAHQLAQH